MLSATKARKDSYSKDKRREYNKQYHKMLADLGPGLPRENYDKLHQPKDTHRMSEELKGEYKTLWIEYQNGEQKEISDLTYDQLNERIAKWEAIEFEARAKRQKDIAEKRVRDEFRKKAERDALINNPKYTPADGPFGSEEPTTKTGKKIPGPKVPGGKRLTKHDKLKMSLGDLGIDLGDLLGDIQKKKADPNGDDDSSVKK